MTQIALLVGGAAHSDWLSYRIDSDLLQPADDWQMSVSYGVDGALPPTVVEGASVKLMLGPDQILDGVIDTIEERISKNDISVEINGRDRASLLLDCAAPLLSLKNATLADIIKQAVAKLGITQVKYTAKPANPRQTVHTEPGQTVWQWLQTACEANQVWPWFDPDGTLIIGAPDYTAPPVASLIMRINGRDNNICSIERTRSLHNVYSEVTVLGQSQGIDGDVGQNNIHGVALDPSVPLYRPHVVIDGNCESAELADRRAAKILADGKMARERIKITVDGHQIDSDGLLWTPGQRINLLCEPMGIDGIYFLMRRTFTLGRNEGEMTELHLVRDGTWLLNIVKDEKSSKAGRKKGRYTKGN